MEISFTILGEPASKSNSRRLIYRGGKPVFIKSQKALDYVATFKEQCQDGPMLHGDLEATIEIYYASRRPDLDESLILDAMQGKVIKNDRQIKAKHIFWHLDRDNPRSIITLRKLQEN